MATHEPILALLADRRIIIKNGGIVQVIETSTQEKANLQILESIDNRMMELRSQLRSGCIIDKINFKI